MAFALCGDDVDGQRVPCRCGDVVVADTRLRADDPVVRERCDHDGLILRARSGVSSIRLDLAGHSIVGLGVGSGIRVDRGGTNGAVIVGGADGAKGKVAGFATGLRARGQRSVGEVRDVVFEGNLGDGLVLRGAATAVTGVEARGNGRDGLRVGGRAPALTGVEASGNRRFGMRVTGRGARVEGAASDNGEDAVRASRRAAHGTGIEVGP